MTNTESAPSQEREVKAGAATYIFDGHKVTRKIYQDAGIVVTDNFPHGYRAKHSNIETASDIRQATCVFIDDLCLVFIKHGKAPYLLREKQNLWSVLSATYKKFSYIAFCFDDDVLPAIVNAMHIDDFLETEKPKKKEPDPLQERAQMIDPLAFEGCVNAYQESYTNRSFMTKAQTWLTFVSMSSALQCSETGRDLEPCADGVVGQITVSQARVNGRSFTQGFVRQGEIRREGSRVVVDLSQANDFGRQMTRSHGVISVTVADITQIAIGVFKADPRKILSEVLFASNGHVKSIMRITTDDADLFVMDGKVIPDVTHTLPFSDAE